MMLNEIRRMMIMELKTLDKLAQMFGDDNICKIPVKTARENFYVMATFLRVIEEADVGWLCSEFSERSKSPTLVL